MPATAPKTTKKCATCKKDRTLRAYTKSSPDVCWHCRQNVSPLDKLIAAEKAAQVKDQEAIAKLTAACETRAARITALEAMPR